MTTIPGTEWFHEPKSSMYTKILTSNLHNTAMNCTFENGNFDPISFKHFKVINDWLKDAVKTIGFNVLGMKKCTQMYVD